MFFGDRIKKICSTDKVLEIGPGGTPHPRSDVFLERRFSSPDEARNQRGKVPELKTEKKIVFYDGAIFPFADKEFDYVICSHVLEHVDNVDEFVSEIMRVGKKGYFEYPTIYYDFMYNFPEHQTFIFKRDEILYWLPKNESTLNSFSPVSKFFYESLLYGYDDIVVDLKHYFFQGFEWEGIVKTIKATNISSVCYQPEELNFIHKNKKSNFLERIKKHLHL